MALREVDRFAGECHELLANTFNRGNQKSGEQQKALAASVDGRRVRPGAPGDLALLDADPLPEGGPDTTSVQQAAGTPKGRPSGFEYLEAFIEDVSHPVLGPALRAAAVPPAAFPTVFPMRSLAMFLMTRATTTPPDR